MNATGSGLPRRRDEARALFRNAILDAAEVVFAERGFHGARIQDIAAHARIAVGTVYNHFEQKEDVLSALLEERMEELLLQLQARRDDPDPFRERLERRVGRMLAFIERHRPFFAIANDHGLFAGNVPSGARPSARPLRLMAKFRSVFHALVEEGIASGDLEPFEPEALAGFLAGTIRASVLWSLAQDRTSAPSNAPVIIDLFLHGAARRRSRRCK
ncbi:MAG TPA: TetR/AcrR family transcriptional regulator [Polyangiaceae bacterium]|nr:TetR/AcrR family transcriptional regulator [Polyangiaceae bacterium]